MRHWNFVVERCERTGKGRGRVPLHDDPIRSPGGEDPGDARQCSPRQIGQILIRPHNFEIPIRPKAEQVENLRQQLAMLAGHADLALKIRSRRELPDHRRQLDRFRARPKDKEKLHPVPELTISVSEPGHVDDDAAHQLLARNLPKPGMRHQ